MPAEKTVLTQAGNNNNTPREKNDFTTRVGQSIGERAQPFISFRNVRQPTRRACTLSTSTPPTPFFAHSSSTYIARCLLAYILTPGGLWPDRHREIKYFRVLNHGKMGKTPKRHIELACSFPRPELLAGLCLPE